MFKRYVMIGLLGALMTGGPYAIATDETSTSTTTTTTPTASMPKAAGRGQCKADVEKFCQDVQGGRGGVAKCLDSHYNELSSECRQNIDDRKAVQAACKNDKEKFCPDAKGGKRHGGGLKQCLEEHKDELEQVCKDALATAKAHRQ